ncbi:MAG: TM2 domain-containing protein [Burkholderiales bacterium]
MKPHKDRFIAALLAFFFGGLGAHRFYLGSVRWWWYAGWLIIGMALFAAVATKATTWILVFALLPVWLGFVEAMAFGVMPDEKWDTRFNEGSGKHSENGWNCVFIAILGLLVGTTIFMTTVILAAQYYYEAAGPV